jgi:long-chain acyl-CoA synthetase
LLFRGSQEQAHEAVVAANRQLAEFQQIRQWRLWPELDLPRTSTGKVRRPKVTEWVNAQRAETSGGAAADPLLALILSISHATAGDAGDDARLSEDLGLDSLGRVQLQSRWAICGANWAWTGRLRVYPTQPDLVRRRLRLRRR